MLKNYFKIALRNLYKYKLHSFINIFGLAAGLASSIVIFLYAQSELSFDKIHKNAPNVYQVYKERINPEGIQIARDTWFPMAKTLKEDFPGVEKAAHFFEDQQWITIDNNKFQESVLYANNDLFDVFSINFLTGNSNQPFKNINSIYLSSSAAKKYFGETNPVGKTINVAYEKDYIVTGVFEDLPSNSTLQINLLVSSESMAGIEEQHSNWSSSYLNTFVLLNPNTLQQNIEAGFPDFIEKIWDKQTRETTNFKLTPLLELHNEETGADQKAYILIAIAVGILLIASINFMNLTTARSIERAKEIGLRKVIGATKIHLIKQFLSESLLMSLLSVVLGLLFVELLLPGFNRLFNGSLSINYFENPVIILQLLLLSFTVGLFSGSYPAFYLSRLQPVDSLKGESKFNVKRINVRHILVVSQFAISVVLIIGTLIMWKQIDYMQNADINLNKEQLVTIPVELSDFSDRETAQVRLESLKNELRSNANILSVASSSHVPGMWEDWFTFVYPADRNESERLRMRIAVVDDKYFDTYGIKFTEGRNFSKQIESDLGGVVLNEAALKAMGWSDIENKQFNRGDAKLKLLGVVKDYNYASLAVNVEPVFHIYRSEENAAHNFVTIKFASNNFTSTLEFVKNKFSELDPSRDFAFNFVDESFGRLYESEQRMASVVSYFSVLGIIIAALGLFALASLTVIRKRKEIGVRKVLGASTYKLVASFITGFLKMTLWGILIALPLSYYFLNEWLKDFAYRVTINPLWFVYGGMAALAVSIITVSIQAFRAANTNPVKSLRNE